MRYSHLLSAILGDVWAIDPRKGDLIAAFIADQVSGIKYSEAEIAARVGQPQAASRVGNVRLKGGGGIAVVPLRGVLSQRGGVNALSEPLASAEDFVDSFQAALADETYSHILLDIDSPGGAINGIPEAAAAIRNAKGQKPITALVNTTAASAAYWLAAQADEVVSSPSGVSGSIGVYTMYENIAAHLEQKGVTAEFISAGQYKTEGNPIDPLSDEARAHIQAQVDDAYQLFVADVAAGRGVAADAVRSGYGQGRAVNAREALAVGLVDRIETKAELITRLGTSKPKSRFSGMSATDWERRHRYA